MTIARHLHRPRLVNLLDDFNLGGVSRALAIFDTPAVRALVEPSVLAIEPGALVAPACDAAIIVLHVPPNWRRLAWLASLRLRNPEARIVWVEHSYTRAWEALKVPARARFRRMLGMAARMVDGVVCVSAGQAAWLEQAAGLRGVRVIHPYVANPGLADLPPRVAGARLRIGAYGRFCEQKGFDVLIAAHRAGAMPGCDLVLGGFGPDEAALRALAGGDPAIRFAGRVEDVAGFLAGVDVVAVPSRWEAYGMVANEAREAARPVLVAPVDGLPEQVMGGAGLVVDFADHGALRLAVETLDGETLAAMAAAGRASTRDCAGQRARAWAGLLADLLAAGLPRAA